ncbi:uncharacterized protein LOC107800659 isoform X2 [Nicotiana tabacum]|uniref:Uncharacterized protein LOC107800659 isoform X2 n=1 Tax=Nicotiana tabacum TaxID=4097 RepID=A0A1S4AS11_TOBAC|nr:PREDICTED: uncharacterized protein LOC107800659 isoform X2 [Nicotiana tabacum]
MCGLAHVTGSNRGADKSVFKWRRVKASMSFELCTTGPRDFSVEELAFLIKDNLPCKHLILAVEETLVNFLLDDTSSSGVLELEPMNPYNRLLLHRLADIFGFSHQSVGEGEERHLVLERCSETSVPSILISDLLWQYDELQSPRTVDVIYRRKEGSEVLFKGSFKAHLSPDAQKSSGGCLASLQCRQGYKAHTPIAHEFYLESSESKVEETPTPIFNISLEEREEAYLAARKQIFSGDQGETRQCMKDRPRKDPMVARRMIAHALGQRIRPSNLEILHANTEECEEKTKDVNIQHKDEGRINLGKQTHMEVKTPPAKYPDSGGSSTQVKKEGKVNKESIREEHIGAAKRIFANALGFAREGNLSK